MEDCNIVLNNIRKLRKIKHITQEELALKVGVTQGTISKMENDKSPLIDLRVLESIAKVLNVCPLSLMSCSKKNCNCVDCPKCSKKIINNRNSIIKR